MVYHIFLSIQKLIKLWVADLVIMNNAACTFTYFCVCGHMSLCPSCRFLGAEFLGYVIGADLNFQEIANLFSKVALPFCFLMSSVWDSNCSASLSTLNIFSLLNCGWVRTCVVSSHCDFNLDCSSNVEHLFISLFVIHTSLLVKYLVIDFVLFFLSYWFCWIVRLFYTECKLLIYIF